jgi:hypothetical protein
MKVSVEQGQIHVNTIHKIHESENAVILYADLKAKYAQVGMFSGDTVYLEKGQYTLHAEESEKPTAIKLESLPNEPGWRLEATASRYELFIYAFKVTLESEEIWADNEGVTP